MLTVLGPEKSRIKVLADSVSGEDSLVPSRCTFAGKGLFWGLFPKDTNPMHESCAPDLTTSQSIFSISWYQCLKIWNFSRKIVRGSTFHRGIWWLTYNWCSISWLNWISLFFSFFRKSCLFSWCSVVLCFYQEEIHMFKKAGTWETEWPVFESWYYCSLCISHVLSLRLRFIFHKVEIVRSNSSCTFALFSILNLKAGSQT